jgi:hypothetical protein
LWHADWLWGPSDLLHQEQSSWGVNLTTHLHQMLRMRVFGLVFYLFMIYLTALWVTHTVCCWMEWSIGVAVEGSGHGWIEVLSWHLAKGTGENHKKSQSGWLVSWLKFKLITPKYKSEALLVDSKWFWRCCITLRITEFFYFIHHSVF